MLFVVNIFKLSGIYSRKSQCCPPFYQVKRLILLVENKLKKNDRIRGYWTLNTNLIEDRTFQDLVKDAAQNLFQRKGEYVKMDGNEETHVLITFPRDVTRLPTASTYHRARKYTDRLHLLELCRRAML